uniref:Uncharacterized protein n=1 Tax=Glossina austeni TaxID=7395 RepID=A0A1A9V6M1_GLOAU
MTPNFLLCICKHDCNKKDEIAMGNDLTALTEKFNAYKTLLNEDRDLAIPPTAQLYDFLDLRSSNPDPDMHGDHTTNLRAQEPPRKSILTAGLRCGVVEVGSD